MRLLYIGYSKLVSFIDRIYKKKSIISLATVLPFQWPCSGARETAESERKERSDSRTQRTTRPAECRGPVQVYVYKYITSRVRKMCHRGIYHFFPFFLPFLWTERSSVRACRCSYDTSAGPNTFPSPTLAGPNSFVEMHKRTELRVVVRDSSYFIFHFSSRQIDIYKL